jgi:hypothetical protein
MSPRKSSPFRVLQLRQELVSDAVENHLRALSLINDNEVVTDFGADGATEYYIYVKEEH